MKPVAVLYAAIVCWVAALAIASGAASIDVCVTGSCMRLGGIWP